MTIYPPYVIERTSRGERSYDIFSRLLMDRIVFLGNPIDDNVANILIAQLLFLDAEDPERDVYLYVNSPGGNVYSGLAVYDTMQHLRAPVSTFCVGMAASMAAVLVAAGEKGKRSALPNSRIMIHQPSSGAQGTAADIEIAYLNFIPVTADTAIDMTSAMLQQDPKRALEQFCSWVKSRYGSHSGGVNQ